MFDYINKYIKKDFFQLIYHVTFRCNARCRFCFNWRHLNKNNGKELSLEEIERFSKSMPKFPWLLLSGGEPILRSDLNDIIEIFYRNNEIKHLTLPTNGLLPARIFQVSKNLLDRYRNLTITVAFSLDSVEKEHDKLRGVKGCYEKLMESYNLLAPLRKNKKLNVKFNTVISSANYQNLGNLIKLIRILKPDMHTIDFIRGDVKDKTINLLPKENIEKVINLINKNYDYYNGYSNISSHSFMLRKVSKAVQKGYLSLFKEIVSKEKQVIPCLAYKTSLALYPYGTVSFCEPLNSFANIRDYDYDFKKLINSETARNQIDLIKKKKCFCYHPCYQYLNFLFDSKRLAKEVIKNVF